MENTVKDIRKRKRTRATNRRRRRVETKDMVKKNGLSKRRESRHIFLKKIILRK
jgi:hypothetical protein